VDEAVSSPTSAQAEPEKQPGLLELSAIAGPAAVFVIGFLLILPIIIDSSAHRDVLGKYSIRTTVIILALLALDILIALNLARKTAAWNRKREGRSPFKRLVFYAVVLFVVVLVAEAGFRWFVDTVYNPHKMLAKYGNATSPFLYYEEAPNAEWKIAGATYRTDEYGFRKGASKTVKEKRPGIVRVAAVGASSVLGYGLEDDKHWPALLLKKLNASGEKWEVINAGNNGYNSFQTFLRTYKSIIPFSPDVVVYYGGYNDKLQSTRDFNRTFGNEYFFFQKWSQHIGEVNGDRNWYMRHMVTVFFADYMLDRLLRISRDPPGIGSDKTDYHYRTNIELLSDLCKRRGARLVLVTFGHGYKSGSPDGASVERRNEALKKIAEAEGLEVVDYAAASGGYEKRITLTREDGYHPSAAGAEAIAAVLDEYLAPKHGEFLKEKTSE
jgi:lysophospholipase L1-like esterase